MKLPEISLAGWLIPMVLLIPCAGCQLFEPQDDPTHYYVLGSLDETGSSKKLARDSDLVILFGPVSVATYLDRNQFVSRKGGNELEVAEFHVWAESLDKGISRVVTQNLSQLLDSSSVVPYPEVDVLKFDYRVGLLINRFEPTGKGTVILDGSWGISGAPGSEIKPSAHSSKITVSYEEPVAPPPPTRRKKGEPLLVPSREATAAALSEAVNRLSVEIAQALLKRGKPVTEEDEESEKDEEDEDE